MKSYAKVCAKTGVCPKCKVESDFTCVVCATCKSCCSRVYGINAHREDYDEDRW